eukprot:1140421-Pelagomonas_calceolata.AAC.7
MKDSGGRQTACVKDGPSVDVDPHAFELIIGILSSYLRKPKQQHKVAMQLSRPAARHCAQMTKSPAFKLRRDGYG